MIADVDVVLCAHDKVQAPTPTKPESKATLWADHQVDSSSRKGQCRDSDRNNLLSPDCSFNSLLVEAHTLLRSL